MPEIDSPPTTAHEPSLSRGGRWVVLVTAFLGWMCAGMVMSIVPLAGRPVMKAFFPLADKGVVGDWMSRYTCAFMLGAAVGGLAFGWLGDRFGRARAMGWSILCYSAFTGAAYFARGPSELLGLCFLACLGVGGMWPNGVALASESWSNLSRPLLSGLLGASANVGFMIMSSVAAFRSITASDWRWVMLVGATPGVLGVFSLLFVPESPRWKPADRRGKGGGGPAAGELFRPPLLGMTLLGICLGAIPLMGNWGSANWLVPWAHEVGGKANESLQAWTQWSKSFGGAVGSLLGGLAATLIGRRMTYFLISAASLAISFSIFRFLRPGDPSFAYWVFAIGFTGTLYFGWLPLFLPELFPTRVRAMGNGVSFNFGRVLTALGVLGTGQLMRVFAEDYARVGQITCLVYVLGMIVIWFAPDMSKGELRD